MRGTTKTSNKTVKNANEWQKSIKMDLEFKKKYDVKWIIGVNDVLL